VTEGGACDEDAIVASLEKAVKHLLASPKESEANDAQAKVTPQKAEPRPVTVEAEKLAPTETEDLPEAPSKIAIVTSMRKISPRISACFQKYKVPGVVIVRVKAAPDWTILGVAAEGAIAATPTGSCVTVAVSHAILPRSKNGASFTYPIVMR
jgi:hypothetical protein